MTRFNYFRCDECGKILENIESVENQLMYTLIANYDTSNDVYYKGKGHKAHFCGQKCLKKYVNKKVKEHHDLPNIRDGERHPESITFGEMYKEKEKAEQK